MSFNYSTFENLNTLFTTLGQKLSGKQNTLTDGDGIDITSDTISVDEMPSNDMSSVVYPLPTPMSAGVANPIGCIITMMGVNAPNGYLKCDGTVYNIADYTLLANYFESEFGSKNYFGGNGTTTFAVPDLRGEFLRGTGTNSHTDGGDGASVGTHQGSTEINPGWFNDSYGGFSYKDAPSSTYQSLINNIDYDHNLGARGAVTSGSPLKLTSASTGNAYMRGIRPTNTSVLYCIKY